MKTINIRVSDKAAEKYLSMNEQEKDRLSIFVEVIHTINECRDPKDNIFLELAVSGNADLIISGDNDLLVLNPFRGIPVITPGDFIDNY